MEKLLPYYERELAMFRQYSKEFSERYPKTAGMMFIAGETSEDPHVERIIQSLALMTARISKRLADDYPKFTESLLESLYPHYLRPVPSYSIVQIDGNSDTGSAGVTTVPRGTVMRSDPISGVACQFRTVYEVMLGPIVLSEVRYVHRLTPPNHVDFRPDVSSGISIAIDCTGPSFDLAAPKLNKLRVFVDCEPSMRAALIDTLFMHTADAYVQADHGEPWLPLKGSPLRLVGFNESDGMIPFTSRSHPSFRLLTEYFAYPEKFNFFDIDLTELKSLLPKKSARCVLHLGCVGLSADSDDARLLGALKRDNLRLGCTPVINLFSKRGVPVQLTHTTPDYPVLADATHAFGYEVYAVNNAQVVKDTSSGRTVEDFSPLYSVQHDGATSSRKANYFLTRRDDAVAAVSPGHEIRIALMDADFVTSQADSSTLCTELECTNRNLPSLLRIGRVKGDLTTDAVAPDIPIRLLRKPSLPYRFNAEKDGHWRLISHLALNFSTLTNDGLSDFKKMLLLYDLPRSATSQRQINGIVGLEHGTVRAWMKTKPSSCLMPGVGIRLTVDEQAFVGSGIYVFAQVIDHYFGLGSQLNCFTQLEIVSQQSGEEILKCPPRSAEQIRA